MKMKFEQKARIINDIMISLNEIVQIYTYEDKTPHWAYNVLYETAANPENPEEYIKRLNSDFTEDEARKIELIVKNVINTCALSISSSILKEL